MTHPSPCPRCQAPRLAVIYYDAEGRAIGGHLHCPECGARHAVRLVPAAEAGARAELLRRKAS
jgi:transcription elongation factor Elf1